MTLLSRLFFLADDAHVVPTEAVVQSEVRRKAEAVLGIEAEVVFERVPVGVAKVLE